MTLFEYLAIAFSLLFSFSVMRLVSGLPHAVRRGRRYWIHLSFVCLQLFATVLIFWLFWSLRTVVWNFPAFMLVLTSPGLIYYNACTLIPENPSAIESWSDYYYSVRTRYFIGISCWMLAAATISTVVLELPLLHPARGAQAAFFAAGVVGATSASPRVHAGLVVLVVLLLLVTVPTVALWPDSFMPP